MSRFIIACVLSLVAFASEAADPAASTDVVVRWNQILLSIIRTPGAQPATIHPTRGLAMMHAAIYDAVNAIDRRHRPYAVDLSGVSRHASEVAGAAAAAHDVLVALYPGFALALDADLGRSLAAVPDGTDKVDGIRVGKAAATAILSRRSGDGALAPPPDYVFGTAPGDTSRRHRTFPSSPSSHTGPR